MLVKNNLFRVSSYWAVLRTSEIKRMVSDHLRWSTIISKQDRRKFRERLLPRTTPHIGIVGAPLVYGQPLTGTDAAPGLLRKSGLTRRLRQKGSVVTDYGDLEFELVPHDDEVVAGCKNSKTVGKATHQIATKVSEVVKNGELCLILGGDHSVSIGSVYAHLEARPDTALIWVDAHADINTPVTTESGNIHGMVLGFLMKELPHVSSVPGMEWCKPCISSKQVAYVGLRSVDPEEQKFIRDLDICAYWMEDIHQLGIEEVLARILERLDPGCTRPLHLSMDVDAIDPTHVPATGTSVPGGLTLREALKIARTIHSTASATSVLCETALKQNVSNEIIIGLRELNMKYNRFLPGRLSMMDVTELNPLLCSTTMANWSADVVLELIVRSFFSKHWKPDLISPRH